jgi:hypothetical protein
VAAVKGLNLENYDKFLVFVGNFLEIIGFLRIFLLQWDCWFGILSIVPKASQFLV